MYIIIRDNIVTDYADWQFPDSLFVDIDYNTYKNDKDRFKVKDGTLIDLSGTPQYEKKKAKERQNEFNKEFFNTSLGYIRRKVTMQDGSRKDFLSDLLPIIKIGVEVGQSVTIIAYNKPPFDHDIEDWTSYQHMETVTVQFIQECILQVQNDFLPIPTEE